MKRILIYDLAVAPIDTGLEMDKILEFYRQENIIVWDSSKATEGQNCKPQIIMVDGEPEVEVLDLATTAGMTRFSELLKSISREDIEALGFEQFYAENGRVKFRRGELVLDTCIEMEDQRKTWFTILDGEKICFQGKLVSKPELLKILKQIVL